MKSFNKHTGIAGPMDRVNVDTDLIIPKQFLKSIQRSGFGPNLFDEVRYLDKGEPGKSNEGRPLNPDFPLNFARYQGTSVLLGRDNFGCGSSREHAPWALEEFGIYSIIAPSFADIFYNNCFKNGILPVVLSEDEVEELFQEMYATEGYKLTIDLPEQRVTSPQGKTYSFSVDAFRKHCLLNGLDDIELTLQEKESISAFEEKHQLSAPWLFNALNN